MANDRISTLERDLRAKSESRDAEINDLREALAVVTSEQAGLKSSHAELAAVVAQLRDPPGLGALWGPAIATAVALAGGFGFILNERFNPMKAEVDQAKQDVRDLSGVYGQQNARVSGLEAQAVELRKDIDMVDQYGSRRWNQGPPPGARK
jgi:hypothetical protein